jgi:hypothetical protein
VDDLQVIREPETVADTDTAAFLRELSGLTGVAGAEPAATAPRSVTTPPPPEADKAARRRIFGR